MLAHLRTEAYPVYREHHYPPDLRPAAAALSYERNLELIRRSKADLEEIHGADVRSRS